MSAGGDVMSCECIVKLVGVKMTRKDLIASTRRLPQNLGRITIVHNGL